MTTWGKEHLARPEEVADDAHAVHERPFDHVDRLAESNSRRASSVSSINEGVTIPLDEGIGTGAWRRVSSRQERVDLTLLCRRHFNELIRDVEHALGRVVAAVEDDVLDALTEIYREVLA